MALAGPPPEEVAAIKVAASRCIVIPTKEGSHGRNPFRLGISRCTYPLPRQSVVIDTNRVPDRFSQGCRSRSIQLSATKIGGGVFRRREREREPGPPGCLRGGPTRRKGERADAGGGRPSRHPSPP